MLVPGDVCLWDEHDPFDIIIDLGSREINEISYKKIDSKFKLGREASDYDFIWSIRTTSFRKRRM